MKIFKYNSFEKNDRINLIKKTVESLEIARIIKKYSINDTVIVKMDIEGAEYDLFLDFVKKDVFKLIDFIVIKFNSAMSPYKKPEDVIFSIINLLGAKFLIWDR